MCRDEGHTFSIGFDLPTLNFGEKKRCALFIKVTCWFVKEHEPRAFEKGAGDADPSLRSLRELTEGAIDNL
jgi:hypothetical protein